MADKRSLSEPGPCQHAAGGVHLASKLLEPSAPAPTISQSTARTGVRPWVSAMASGAFVASSGSAASRRLFLLPAGVICAFRAAQLALIFVPAHQHPSCYKPYYTNAMLHACQILCL